jgi:phenylpropionate dioxygenase-like ring-hydroxylating dioxygenase large terminal subunit
MASGLRQAQQAGRIGELRTNDPRLEIPALGFRNYWYPVMFSKALGPKPVRMRLLGDDVIVLRSKGKARTLQALCPHRGAPLALGVCLKDGTISCWYHGFTFDTETGECIAALSEGPESAAPGHLAARTYPTEERCGLVWVYVGEGIAPPIEEDLPEDLLHEDAVLVGRFSVWNIPWRPTMDNGIDTAHPFFLHRKHPYVRFDTLPAFAKVKPVRNGKWLRALVEDVSMGGDFPGFGQWPPARDRWFRRPKASVKFRQELRLPGVARITWEPSGLTSLRFSVPVDEKRTLTLQCLVRRANGLKAIWFKLHYYCYEMWRYHVWFQEDDKTVLDSIDPLVPEKLTQSDVAVVHWRRMAREARQPSPQTEKGANG